MMQKLLWKSDVVLWRIATFGQVVGLGRDPRESRVPKTRSNFPHHYISCTQQDVFLLLPPLPQALTAVH